MKRFEGRAAIVTGAGSWGFGRATCLRLAREGAKVLAADLNEAGAKETMEQVKALGVDADIYVGDIATAAGATAMAKLALERFGTIDVLVNNAGICPPAGADSWDAPEESWDQVIRVNLKSVYLCSRAVIPTMIAKGGGSIVNVASMAARITMSCASYAATKAGMLGYSQQVATELAERKVRVNSVSPGIMLTPMSTGERYGLNAEESKSQLEAMAKLPPMKHLGSVDDIAAAIAFLASDDAAYITGREILVDGGYISR